ncbi:MAG: metal-dependent hydrolase [Nitrososphaerales archaeon]
MTFVQSQTRSVPTRTVEFDAWLEKLPKYFAADGDIVMSHILSVLSSVFPDGEDYFVRSVEAGRDQIRDPVLREDVEGFIGQESMHGREHRVLNEHLAEFGYPTRAIGAYVRWLFRTRERIRSKRLHLAFTAALEHYTATLAETLLTDPDARAVIDHDGVRYLFMWHALEESEHKAVAFDVYTELGGTERMRIAAMWLTHLLFVLETSIWAAISLGMDPDARRHPLRVVRSLMRLPRSPFTRPRAVRQLFEYNRRGFHPNDRDTGELIEEWRGRLFGSNGRLEELLTA